MCTPNTGFLFLILSHILKHQRPELSVWRLLLQIFPVSLTCASPWSTVISSDSSICSLGHIHTYHSVVSWLTCGLFLYLSTNAVNVMYLWDHKQITWLIHHSFLMLLIFLPFLHGKCSQIVTVEHGAQMMLLYMNVTYKDWTILTYPSSPIRPWKVIETRNWLRVKPPETYWLESIPWCC